MSRWLLAVPPTKPTCRLHNSTGLLLQSLKINVVKGESISIFCESSAMPAPEYSWTTNATYQTPTPQTIEIVSIQEDTTISVTATNRMHSTGGIQKPPTFNSTSIEILLYSKYLFYTDLKLH